VDYLLESPEDFEDLGREIQAISIDQWAE
jgi:hypothetical protein